MLKVYSFYAMLIQHVQLLTGSGHAHLILEMFDFLSKFDSIHSKQANVVEQTVIELIDMVKEMPIQQVS